jgi:hypothetical protein
MVNGRTEAELIKHVQERAAFIKNIWTPRQAQIEEWYEAIRLDDYLAQKNMESFISNEPKTGFNLANHLLTNASIIHGVDRDGLDSADEVHAASLERGIRHIWRVVNKENKRRGRKSWLREFNGYMLATGWYSVFLGIDRHRAWAEIWNPYEVFPLWDDDFGLVELVHEIHVLKEQAQRIIRRMGSPVDLSGNRDKEVTILDYWWLDNNGVHNSVIVDRQVVKPATLEPQFGQVIPIVVGPVGGLPDRGVLPSNKTLWTRTVGESIVSANMGVQRNFNKQMTFLQQILRDTANPRCIEKNKGEPILDSEKLFLRGAIFRMGLDESVEPMGAPAIPIEATSSLRDIGDMVQQGLFPKAAFGTSTQPMSALMMSQIVSSSQHVLSPFIEGLQEVLSEVDNFWSDQMLKRSYKPFDLRLALSDIPKDLEFQVEIHPRIPGDLVNRATVGRMLNPEFKLSQDQIREFLYPEITDPMRERSRIRAEQALQHPVAQDLVLVEAYLEESEALLAAGDTDGAARFRRAADMVEQSMGQRNGHMNGTGPVEPGPAVMPSEVTRVQ